MVIGGGLALIKTNSTLKDSLILECQAGGMGGGVFLTGDGSAILSNVTIQRTQAVTLLGNVYL